MKQNSNRVGARNQPNYADTYRRTGLRPRQSLGRLPLMIDRDYSQMIPGSRTRRLILAALRVWELKNGIHG
jgi:hypothetical protein